MYIAAFTWACLACLSFVHQSQASNDRGKRNPFARYIPSAVDRTAGILQAFKQDNDWLGDANAFGRLKVLARVMLAFNPVAVPTHSAPRVHSLKDSPYLDSLRRVNAHGEKRFGSGNAMISMQTPPGVVPGAGMLVQPTPPVYPELKALLDKAVAHIKSRDAQGLRTLLLDSETEVGFLVAAVRTGRNALTAPADAYERTLLHLAAASGDVECVQAVLDACEAHERALGVPVPEIAAGLEMWSDAHGLRAAEYAVINGNQQVFDMIIDSACRRPLRSVRTAEEGDGTGREYLKRKLKYEGDVLYDSGGHGIMMGWETPLMKAHAEAIMPQPGRGRVLNIGFGLGIVDGCMQDRQPEHHVIVEAHPDVHAEMQRRGWTSKPGVTVLFGRWQEVADQVTKNGPYDGIFFDTWAEVGADMITLFNYMREWLAPGGRFSWFNGLSDGSVFANAAQFRLQQMQLAREGLACHYKVIPFGEVGDAEWRKVNYVYWPGATYYLPIAVNTGIPADVNKEESADDDGNDKELAEARQGARIFAHLKHQPAEDGMRASAIQIGDEFPKVMEKKMLAAWWNDLSSGQEMLGLGEERTVRQAFTAAR